ncbi:hypothetical protein QJS04_geneDACA018866 [Acorus gramineus]|uniref:Uncharacterized protein n=1 Tax=Acorus gramineus TaxID=55184 RepID=A0AAV9BWI8_ACOGR|nr:hypothetical protein QJS04_geneDACA018866 [Acorus gramineus]
MAADAEAEVAVRGEVMVEKKNKTLLSGRTYGIGPHMRAIPAYGPIPPKSVRSTDRTACAAAYAAARAAFPNSS